MCSGRGKLYLLHFYSVFVLTFERRVCGLLWSLVRNIQRGHLGKQEKLWENGDGGKRNRDEQRYGKKKKNKNKTKPRPKVSFPLYYGEEFGNLLNLTHGFLPLDAHSFYVLLTISSWSSCLLCCQRLPVPSVLVNTQSVAVVTCSSSLRAVPWAFTSCQSRHYSVPINITLVTSLIDVFGNRLTFHFCFKPCKSVTLWTR